MFLELHISKDNKNSYRRLCISKDEMFNTWRYVFIPCLNEDDLECLIERQLFAGTSPAPKQGPQNAERTVAPESIMSPIAPLFTRLRNTGWLEGYTLKANSPAPME